jgi:hypothetical protein
MGVQPSWDLNTSVLLLVYLSNVGMGGGGAATTPIPIGGAGHPASIWWGVRKHKRFNKNLDWLLDRVVSEFYGELTDPEMPVAAKKAAAKIVRPYAKDGEKIPQSVDWSKMEQDVDRVMMLLELYQKYQNAEDDDLLWMMMH